MRKRRHAEVNDDIVRKATAVREAMDTLWDDGNGGPAYTKTLEGACGDCSLVLAEMIGHGCQLEEGTYGGVNNHSWVRLDDRTIVDVTATQFGIRRKVYVTRSTKYDTRTSGQTAVESVRRWGYGIWRKKLRRLAEEILETT